MSFSEEEILETITLEDSDVTDYFIVGGLPCTWHDETGLNGMIVEDDDLAEACLAYLRDKGCREFATMEDFEASRKK